MITVEWSLGAGEAAGKVPVKILSRTRGGGKHGRMRWKRALMTLLASAAVASPALVLVDTVPAQAAPRVCTSYTEALAYVDSGVRYWVRRPTVGYNSWDHNCTLRVGDNAPGAIRALQAAIRCSDGGNVGIDGVFGTQTRQGVINVQSNRQVGVDGIYGPQTAHVMTFGIFIDSGWFASCNSVWG